MESGKFCLRNPESGALESRKQLNESGILPAVGILNASSIDKESGMHGVESRIQTVLDSLHGAKRGRPWHKHKHKHKKNAQVLILLC